jgi:hypothetical protein
MARSSLSSRSLAAASSLVALSLFAVPAAAEESTAPATTPPSTTEPAPTAAPTRAPAADVAAPKKAEPAPAVKKGAYALPFSMRPAIASNLVRIDGTLASTSAVGTAPAFTTYVSVLTAGYKPISSLPDLGFYLRAAIAHNVPEKGLNGTATSNPLVFGLFAPEIAPHVRLALFLGVTAPIGAGGGDTPYKTTRGTLSNSIYARQAMDNALFATNYLTPTAGVGLAFIDKGFTAQVEATLLELIRARGSAQDTESTRTNFTAGLNVGYRIIPELTANVELHYQRWLSTPVAVTKDDTKRSQMTFGVGLRANLPLTNVIALRPGLGYFQGIDDPMSLAKYRIVQLDVPIVF